MKNKQFGIIGQAAPSWKIAHWIDQQGRSIGPLGIDDYHDKVLVVYCFQALCSGSHSLGFPSFKAIYEQFKDEQEVEFLAIQTVFEEFDSNTEDNLPILQEKNALPIPFAHDPGHEQSGNRSDFMFQYRTGGTPWFVLIGKDGRVLYNGNRFPLEKAETLIKLALAGNENRALMMANFPGLHLVKLIFNATEGVNIHAALEGVLAASKIEAQKLSTRKSGSGKYEIFSFEVQFESLEHFESTYARFKEMDQLVQML